MSVLSQQLILQHQVDQADGVLYPIFGQQTLAIPVDGFGAEIHILCIIAILYSVCYSILSSIILAISWRLYWLVSTIGILGIALFIWFVIGIINAANGKAKELPLIGHYKLLKI